MEKSVKVLVLRTAGTNCDAETVFAFESFGAQADLVHINKLFSNQVALEDYHILAIPGGFTYGDDIAAGRILANELRLRLGDDINRFVNAGKLVIGICNGFQVLVKAGFLPGFEASGDLFQQRATLMTNDSAKFEARWVYLRPDGHCVWTKGMEDIIYLPVAHGEGKFVPQNEEVRKRLMNNHQIVFRYCCREGREPRYPENPNGSVDNIAGICDSTGRILGLMPHPERHFLFTQHPFWTRLERKTKLGHGAKIFENGVRYVKDNLLKGMCNSVCKIH